MSNQPLRTIFVSTPDFGIPALKKLFADPDFEIITVITQPDKPVGRKQILTPPPVKALAQELKLPLLQPEKISDIQEKIANLKPDLMVVIAYGQIMPKSILAIPQHGCINIHGSLLPKYRGAACVQAPILNGDAETGVTIMKMDEGLDTGPIIKQVEIKLNNTETAGSLYQELSELGAGILAPTLKDYVSGKITSQAQDNSLASYVKELKKSDGEINWQKSATEIERFVRAMTPWPGASAHITQNTEHRTIKILGVEKNIVKINKHKPGEFFTFEKKLTAQCGQDALIISQIQPEGKREITGEEFIRGYEKYLTN